MFSGLEARFCALATAWHRAWTVYASFPPRMHRRQCLLCVSKEVSHLSQADYSAKHGCDEQRNPRLVIVRDLATPKREVLPERSGPWEMQ